MTSKASRSESLEGVAIIGMAGRFPGANDIEAFWRNLCQGVESRTLFGDAELEAAGVPRELRQRSDYVRAGFVIDDADLFDASFFGYSPREAALLDPQHRAFLECAWHALEHAGHCSERSERSDRSVSVFASTSTSSYLLAQLGAQPDLLQQYGLYSLLIGNDKDYLATRVSHRLDLRGPSMTVQSACSSSLVAVHLACQSLLDGESDMALAGGVCIFFPQRSGYLFQEGMILSPDGHCRAFDEDSQGTVRGSGVGIVVLRRLADAVDDGDTIYAVIRGSALNNDGATKVGFTAPSVNGQASVISEALDIAGVSPDSIQYVEAHGTGTALGDPIEVSALNQAYQGHSGGPGAVALGSLKTNIGHLDAAAGVAGLLKTTLALRHETLPPSLHFTKPNPRIDFNRGPFYINTTPRAWVRGDTPRRAAVSSFGIGGTNAHVILEEAPASPTVPCVDTRPRQLLLLSARSHEALEQASLQLGAHLEQSSDVPLADVAYTLQVGRRRFEHRRMLVCKDGREARNALAPGGGQGKHTRCEEATSRPVIFVFPGSGVQYVSMGRDLYESEPRFQAPLNECFQLLRPLLGFDLKQVVYPEPSRLEEASRRLQEIAVMQPAIFAIEYALARWWMEMGLQPQAMIGHSLGEYVVACLAGVLSLEDALLLVAARSRLMHALPEAAMLSVPLSESELEPLLGPTLSVAAANAPSLSVVGGPPRAVEELETVLRQRGVESRRLRMDRAPHTATMDPILDAFASEVRAVRLSAPRLPYASNVTGTWASAEQVSQTEYWVDHLRRPVRFAEGLRVLLAAHPDAALLELGPGLTMSTLSRQNTARDDARPILQSLRGPTETIHDVQQLLETMGQLWMSGATLDWKRLHEPSKRRRVPLPIYPFQRQRYWLESSSATPRLETAMSKGPCYVPSWRALRSSSRRSPVEPGAAWLLLAEESGFGRRFAEHLEAEGARVVRVLPAESFQRLGGGAYALPPGQPEAYRLLLEDLVSQGLRPEDLVHLWGMVSTEGTLEAELERGFYSVAFLAKALHALALPARLHVVTTGTQDITGEEPLCAPRAMVLGACRVLAQEAPLVRVRVVDARLPEAGEAQWGRLATQVLDELGAEESEPLVALRGSRRWGCREEPMPLPESPATASAAPLRPGGTYVIIGGLGQVGLALAEQLVAVAESPRVVLVGRSSFPERSEWEAWLRTHEEPEACSRQVRRLLALEAAGAQVMVTRADVSEPAQLEAAMAQAEARFGAVHGVVHVAGRSGVSVRQLLGEVSRPECEALFQGPVRGALALARCLRQRTLDFVVLQGSLASVLGGLGLTAYAAAQSFLETFAALMHRASATVWMSVEWDPWPLGNQSGASVLAPEPAEALRLLLGMLRRGTSPRWWVSRQDLSSRLASSQPGPQETKATGPTQSAAPQSRRDGYEAPRDEIERQVASIWQELLDVAEVGISDHFFELGGHSLMGVQVLSRIRETFRVELSLRSLFDSPTVASLALAIANAQVEHLDGEALESLVRELEQEQEEAGAPRNERTSETDRHTLSEEACPAARAGR